MPKTSLKRTLENFVTQTLLSNMIDFCQKINSTKLMFRKIAFIFEFYVNYSKPAIS